MPISVSQIARIQDLGLFRECRASDTPQFRQYNLIYGFNGSGKTTLSRIFLSMGQGLRHPNLPEDGAFEIQLSDGSTQASGGDLNALRGRVLVFNTDFIEESFQWKHGQARPVFYIGKEQAELAKMLAETSAKISAAESDLRIAQTAHGSADRVFSTLKRDSARNIAEQLGLGRRYDATRLTLDYGNAPPTGFQPLNDADLARVRALIAQSEPLPKLEAIEAPDIYVEPISVRGSELLAKSLGQLALSDLSGHESMRSWLGQGLTYHRENDLKNCLFCGNEIAEERRAKLGGVIDSAFENLLRDLRSVEAEVSAVLSGLDALERRLPRNSDVGPEHREQLKVGLTELHGAVRNSRQYSTAIHHMVKEKIESPHRIQSREVLPSQLGGRELDDAIRVALESIRKVLSDHDRACDSFGKAREKAAESLKGHLLEEGAQSYREQEGLCQREKKKVTTIEGALDLLRKEEERLKRLVKTHGPAADIITKMIHNYLGRKELELITADDGYLLRRNGRVVRGSLSEGEKTAIAICYFITTLEAEGRKRADLIVVIDDPVSSLDTRSLNYSFSVIKAMVKDACQVFLLTHNIQFMNEARKWLEPKSESGLRRRQSGKGSASIDPKASLLFLDTIQSGGPETRACHIRELPKHIRDYESEYHYLVHLILKFVADEGATDYFYLMPNALRKVLDVFLAFKIPGPQGLGNKIEKLVGKVDGIDAARIQALERLAQVESHADNLDDLIAFSSTTVEEVRGAAQTLIELLGKLDQEHWAEMKKLCA